jgi:hypothetical protein
MRSRSLATVLTGAIAGSLTAVGEFTPPVVPAVLAQDFRDHVRADYSGMVSRVYDRVTDSTLEHSRSVPLLGHSDWFDGLAPCLVQLSRSTTPRITVVCRAFAGELDPVSGRLGVTVRDRAPK